MRKTQLYVGIVFEIPEEGGLLGTWPEWVAVWLTKEKEAFTQMTSISTEENAIMICAALKCRSVPSMYVRRFMYARALVVNST